MAVMDLLRKEHLWELAAYAVQHGYITVPTKAPEEVLRMWHKVLPILIVRNNKKAKDHFSVEEITADFVKEWAESRGTPYVPQDKNQTTLFDLIDSE